MQKQAIDSSIKAFQPSKKLFFDNYETYDTPRFPQNKYYLREFKAEYGHIFSDTMNNIVRFMLVQGDCGADVFYTKKMVPFRIDHLKMYGGMMSLYLIDTKRTYIIDNNDTASWCVKGAGNYHAELCLDGKRIVYYQRSGFDSRTGDTTQYLRAHGGKWEIKYYLDKFEMLKKEL